MHNSYSSVEIWMLLCCRSSARPRHKMRAKAKSQVGQKAEGENVSIPLDRSGSPAVKSISNVTPRDTGNRPFVGHYVNSFLIQIMLCKRFHVSDNTMHLWGIRVTAALQKNALKSEMCCNNFLSALTCWWAVWAHTVWTSGCFLQALIPNLWFLLDYNSLVN